MPKMMKAQIVKAPYEMEYTEVPVPEISDDEVLIKVKVCGICGSDTSIYTGKYAKDKLPLITGHEFWGEIAEVGKNAKGLKVGDRVAVDICITCGTCYFCRHGDGLLCETFTQLGIHTDGGFAEYVKKTLNIDLDPHALFDVQVKRIHEYKRQMLNVLHIIARYNEMLAEPEKDWQPRVFILAGKAASAYYAAKQTIRLINDVANVINNDERLKGRLKVVFIPNYSVSLAQLIIPAADISEQISLAGTEASGTSNMKFALNGALTLGTLDGANVEILDNVGEDHIFIFGNTVEQVEALRREGYRPFDYYQNDEQLREVIDQIIRGDFSPEEPNRYHSLIQGLQYHDYYQSFADFRSYVEAQKAVDKKYQDRDVWIASTIQNMVNMGFFSSDRTILEYAKNIWKIEPLKLEK